MCLQDMVYKELVSKCAYKTIPVFMLFSRKAHEREEFYSREVGGEGDSDNEGETHSPALETASTVCIHVN